MRFLCLLLLATSAAAVAQQLPQAQQDQIAAAATKVLHDTGVPSASVGVVKDGRIVYTRAFGLANVAANTPATAAIAYPVGSISKQFTATAILLLQQDGKLKLDDPVSKYFPELTRSADIKILNLLTHTSGYQDYAPQDYTIPEWKVPADPLRIVHQFAGKPLDFEPGTQWQYSNTNFVIAALIVQKASGMPFATFMRERVLRPAGLENVLNLNTDSAQLKLTGYMRNALAPIRPAALEAPGWYFGDGDLAMPVASLLKWDLTILNQSLLTPASYKAFETPFLLPDGTDTHYALGVEVLKTRDGHRAIEHSGEVGGFVAENIIFPDEHAAIAVLTNQEASSAATEIAHAITPMLFAASAPVAKDAGDTFAPKLQVILAGLQKGQIDRSLFTTNCNDYFDKDALADFRSSLAPLGDITSLTRSGGNLRGGMSYSGYKATFSNGTAVSISLYLMPDGKIEQLLVVGKF